MSHSVCFFKNGFLTEVLELPRLILSMFRCGHIFITTISCSEKHLRLGLPICAVFHSLLYALLLLSMPLALINRQLHDFALRFSMIFRKLDEGLLFTLGSVNQEEFGLLAMIFITSILALSSVCITPLLHN